MVLQQYFAFLFWLRCSQCIKKWNCFSCTQADQKTLLKNILSGILITLSNPITIAGWLVIAGGFFTHWNQEWPSIHQYGILSIIVMMFGVLSWFTPLLFIIAKVKTFLNNNVIKGFLLISGIFFIGLGFFSIFSATNLLFN